MKRIIFLEPAQLEMADAAEYYEFQASGLGNEFLKEIEAVTERVRRYPDSGRILRGRVRRRIARRFPFGVLYIEDEEEIIVVAVMHLKRRPDYWTKRLKLTLKNYR